MLLGSFFVLSQIHIHQTPCCDGRSPPSGVWSLSETSGYDGQGSGVELPPPCGCCWGLRTWQGWKSGASSPGWQTLWASLLPSPSSALSSQPDCSHLYTDRNWHENVQHNQRQANPEWFQENLWKVRNGGILGFGDTLVDDNVYFQY